MTTEQADALYERHVEALERLLAERGVGRHAVFWGVGERTFLPNGMEDASGFVIDDRGRVFFFWTGWDHRRQVPTLETWKEVADEASWDDDPEYRQARATVGLR